MFFYFLFFMLYLYTVSNSFTTAQSRSPQKSSGTCLKTERLPGPCPHFRFSIQWQGRWCPLFTRTRTITPTCPWCRPSSEYLPERNAPEGSLYDIYMWWMNVPNSGCYWAGCNSSPCHVCVYAGEMELEILKMVMVGVMRMHWDTLVIQWWRTTPLVTW